VAARALEFTILTAARTGDIVGGGRDAKPPMLWAHVDLNARVWVIPSTKTETEHRVPLSNEAVAVLKSMKRQHAKSTIVFPGSKLREPLSNMAMAEAVKRMNEKREARGAALFVDPKQNNSPITVHGFRSTFKDWVSERTNYPNIVSEMALAHKIDDKVEAAYRRGDLFAKRARLMRDWAAFLAKPLAVEGGNVITMSGARAKRRDGTAS
jgi:integrase